MVNLKSRLRENLNNKLEAVNLDTFNFKTVKA